jgi:hypothetical protein
MGNLLILLSTMHLKIPKNAQQKHRADQYLFIYLFIYFD